MTTQTRHTGREEPREPVSGPGFGRRSRWTERLLVAGAAGFLLAFVWAVLRIAGRPVAREGTTEPVLLTTLDGSIVSPSISPDGRQVAFSWGGEARENDDVWVMPVGKGALVRRTTDPAADVSPAFSPDGRSIAFLRRTGRDRTLVVVVPVAGGPERVVEQRGLVREGLAWSADGRALLLAERESVNLASQLFRMSLETGERSVLTRPPPVYGGGDAVPSLSPDGRTLAFSRRVSATSGELWLLPVTAALGTGGEPVPLTAARWDVGGNAWTPDGRRIVLAVGRGFGGSGSGSGLGTVAASIPPGKALPIAGSDGGSSPTCSRDGRLVFVRSKRDENVWRLPLAGGRPQGAAPFLTSPAKDAEPRFSPDGKQVAFCSDRSGSSQVWTCDANGAQAVQRTLIQAGITSGARFSPDGRRLVFISDLYGDMELFLVDAAGGDPVRLTTSPYHETAPSWSRDGKWVYFASNREDGFQVWKMRPEAGAPAVRVTRGGGYAALESADGRTLYFARGAAGWSVWKVPVEGGEETLVLPEIPNWGAFDVTRTALYYVRTVDRKHQLRRIRFADGADELLLALERPYDFGVSAAPDDSAVLFSQRDVDSSDLMLVEGLR